MENINGYSCKSDLLICTGSGAWTKAHNNNWIRNTYKLILPMNISPDKQDWPCADRYVMLFSAGNPDSHERLISLTRRLLQQRAIWVMWVMGGKLQTFKPVVRG